LALVQTTLVSMLTVTLVLLLTTTTHTHPCVNCGAVCGVWRLPSTGAVS
jgi:hypothetical protein